MMSTLAELIRNQRHDVCDDRRLSINDLKRLAKNVEPGSTFFDHSSCCEWTAYVNHNRPRDKYIMFYFQGSKVSLHRLLYENFVGDLGWNDYIKHSCGRRDYCANVNHLCKYQYTNKKYVAPKIKKHKVADDPTLTPEPPPISLTINFS